MKLIPISERHPMARCWFCRTDQSVKYEAKMINVDPKSNERYMHILVCNRCALFHRNDFIEETQK